MKEEFISYLWKNRLLFAERLYTQTGEPLYIQHPGQENHDAGPDYFAARIRIGTTLWVGNVEIHTRSSHWLLHGHQNDPAYDNIILHVVYEHDQEISNSRGEVFQVLEVKDNFDSGLLLNYEKLQSSRAWVPCERQVASVAGLVWNNWLNRLLVERLERKSEEVLHFLEYFGNDWDQTFFFLLARNFGFKVNASPFGLLAQRTPFTLLARNRDNLTIVEALLFGQAALLGEDLEDLYPRTLLKEYRHQAAKHNLNPVDRGLWKFARLRPLNFPSIRIAQFAMLIHQSGHLFRNLLETRKPDDIQRQLRVKASPYWDEHYVFDRKTAPREKPLGKDAINNIIINSLAPVLFIYGRQNMRQVLCDKAIDLLQTTPAENNEIIRKWNSIGVRAQHAADSQALIECKKYYCNPKHCLHCPIGHLILKGG
ncbi:MAG: DUF2851 family protein [Bacteroidales bacterium]|jgi:hypothetical protein|nr:DUF2851 family protein [Bacteroidales bacterium]NLM93013.1 DUF2851 family protein [Bacteroidales bacterium]